MVGLERGVVDLEPYRDEWKVHYQNEIERLADIADEWGLEFEHVGSTAVEGMVAKPIIDILAVVEDLDNSNGLLTVLEEHGYEYRPGDVEGRLFFAKGPRTNRTHYLSLTEHGSGYHREKLAFREDLRAHPEAAEQYASLKRRLADSHPEDRETYTAKKSDFIQDILDRAMHG